MVAQIREEVLLAVDGFAPGAEHAGFKGLEVGGDETLGVLERLLARPGGKGGVVVFDLVAVGGGELDVVAEDFVVADLQRADAGLFDELFLILGEPGVGVALQAAVFVERFVVTVAKQPAVAQVGGGLVDAGGGDAVGQVVEHGGEGAQALVQVAQRRAVGQHVAQLGGAGGAVAQAHQVARQGAAHGQPGGDARHVVDAAERFAQLVDKARVVHQCLHDVLAGFDRAAVGQGVAQPVAQATLAHGGDAGGAAAGAAQGG